MLLLRRLLLIALVAAILVGGWSFAARNGETVTLDLGVTLLPGMPLWQLLLIGAGAGLLIGWLLTSYRLARAGLAARRYRKTIRGLEAEVSQLRNLPLDSPPSSSDAVDPDGPEVAAASGPGPGS